MNDDEVRFKFKLASHLGIINPRSIDFLLTPNELNAWAEYFALEPFLADRIEAQLSFISAQIYNLFAKEPKGSSEFMVSAGAKKDKKSEFEKRLKDVFGI